MERSAGLDGALFIVALLLVSFAPILLGSFRPRFWHALESAVFLLFALFCIVSALKGRTDAFKGGRVVVLFLAGWLLWPLVQLIPLPAELTALISGKVVETSRLAPSGGSYISLSTQKFSTIDEILKRVMYVCVFSILMLTRANRGLLKAAVMIVAAFALLLSIYVFLEYAADPQGVVRGTYTNRNHFALYIAMSLSVLLGYCMTIVTVSGHRGLEVWLDGRLLGALGVVLVLLTVLMITQSKGAATSFAAAMLLTWIVLRERGTDSRSGRSHYAFLFVAGAVVVSILLWGVSDLFSRFTVKDVFADERWLQWRDSLRLAVDYWLTGSGAGTYEYVFPAYKSSEYRPLLYHHVHNDYIEAFCNEGVIGLVLLTGVFVSWLATMRKRYLARRDPFVKGIAFGIYLAATTAMVHAFFDFNLQVPANALILFALMGMGLTTVRTCSRRHHGTRQ